MQRPLPDDDAYQAADRVTKYGVLVIALTFAAIFLVGLWRGGQAHPVQYVLVGAALCLFYLLLLSLAEHIPFGWAYLIAAAVNLTMVAFIFFGWKVFDYQFFRETSLAVLVFVLEGWGLA